MYTDPLLVSENHLLGKKFVQTLKTCIGYSRFVTLRKKFDAYLALSKVLQEVVVPNGNRK